MSLSFIREDEELCSRLSPIAVDVLEHYLKGFSAGAGDPLSWTARFSWIPSTWDLQELTGR